MSQWEITQAGVNSILDVPSSGVRSNLKYINAYLVDDSFDIEDFKALTTVVAQKQYLSNHSLNGYSQPPFANNNDDQALNRETGGDTANQPAITANVNNVDRMTYLYQLRQGFGNYYFNLLVSYNSVDSSNPESDDDMPIFGVFLFESIQNKLQVNQIELYATFEYNGLAGAIEFVIDETQKAVYLEVSSVDLLPPPPAAPTNTYLITNPDNVEPHGHTPFDNSHLAIQQGNLWSFSGYSNTLGSESGASSFDITGQTTTSCTITLPSSNAARLNKLIDNSVTPRGQYIIQFDSGDYIGVCRVASLSSVSYVVSSGVYNLTFSWSTPLPTVPDSFVRIYVANEFAYTVEQNTDPVELTGNDTLIHLYGKNYYYSSSTTSHTVSLYPESQYNTRDTTFICGKDSDYDLIIELSGSITAVWDFNEIYSIDGYRIKPGEIVILRKIDENYYLAHAPYGVSEIVDLGSPSTTSFDSGSLVKLIRKGDFVDLYSLDVISHDLSSGPSVQGILTGMYESSPIVGTPTSNFSFIHGNVACSLVFDRSALGTITIFYRSLVDGSPVERSGTLGLIQARYRV